MLDPILDARKKKVKGMKEPEEKRKTGQEEKVRELEEKIKKLEEEKAKKKGQEFKGLAADILTSFGKTIPGADNLVKSLEKSEAFQERLEEIDKEVERKLREAPLKKVERKTPPIRTSFSRPPLVKDKPFFKEPSPPKPREPLLDIFDEKEHLRIIAELPGVEEKDIKIDLRGDKLTLSADTAAHKYHQQLTLPCLPKDKLEKVFRNGILEIKIQKTDQN